MRRERGTGRRGAAAPEPPRMARRKRTTKLRPKSPARIRKRRRAKSGRAHAHRTELWGLALVALGIFLGALLYLGWNGGVVGGAITDAITTVVGDAGYVLPVALVCSAP